MQDVNEKKALKPDFRKEFTTVIIAELFLIFTISIPSVLGVSDLESPENSVYRIDVNLPATMVYNVSVAITVPKGMIYDAGSLQTIGAEPTQNITSISPGDATNGVLVALYFGDFDNTANQDLLIRFKSTVSNADIVQNGLALPPINATLQYRNANGDMRSFSGEMERVTVVEPYLEVERRFEPAGGWRGDTINCSLLLRHSRESTADAYDVAVSESLPEGLTYLPGSAQIENGPAGSVQEDSANLTLLFSRVNLSWSGEQKIRLSYQATVDSNVQANESLPCRATVNWTSTAGENPDERAYTITSEGSLTLVPRPADLKITMTDRPDPVRPGGLLNYTMSSSNSGGYAMQTAVDADYDPNLAFVSANPAPDAGTDNHWTLGDLDNNSTSIIIVTLRADALLHEGTILSSTANISSRDGTGAQASALTNVSRMSPPKPDLEIDRTISPTSGWRGDIANCNLFVRHSFMSNGDAYDVAISESLPEGLIYLPGSMQIVNGPEDGVLLDGPVWRFSQVNKSWEDDNKIQLRYQARIDTKVQANDSLKWLATLNWTDVAGEDPEEQHYTKTSEGSIMLIPKQASFKITLADNPDPVRPDGLLNYTVNYLNAGGYALQTAVKADWDPNLTFVSAIPGPDTGTDSLWTLGDLDREGSGTIRAILRAASSLPDDSMLSSSVQISSPDGVATHASAMTAVSNTAPLLFIEKSASDQLIRPGGTLNYTINYRNGGSVDAGNVTVTDCVDSNLIFNPECANPKPSQIWQDDQGTYLYWNASSLGTQTLLPEGSGMIEFSVSLPAVPEHPAFDWVYNNYRIDSDLSQGQFQVLATPVVHSLFVRKKADKEMYMRGDTVNYTITYGNELAIDATDANVTDILPDVEYLDANPQPNFNNGSVLVWNIGPLPSKSSGTIQLYTRINRSQKDFNFMSSQSVSGQGYMQMNQKLSTARDPKRLTNYVKIYARYEGLPWPDNDSSSATIGLLDALGTEVSIQGHGSGSYSREQEINVRTNNSSIKVDTSLHERYRPSSFTLPGGRQIGYDSKWSEAVVAKNRITGGTTNERYMYASSIDRNSSLHLDKNGSTIISETAFEGSGHIGQLKSSQLGDSVFSRRTPDYDSDENYLGSFKVITKYDEYGKSVISSRSVNGTGYVSSDKRIKENQRSYESGTGNYQAEDEIRTGGSYMAKDMKASFAPVSFSYTPSVKVNLSMKWNEGMWSRSGKPPVKGATGSSPSGFISEEYSEADFLNKSTVASGLNQMKTEAEFNGRAQFQVAYNDNLNKSIDRVESYDEYAGQFKLSRNVKIGGVARFDEPHLSITKVGKLDPAGGSNINYLITVTNDGNQDLGPVYVQDMLPSGTEYVYSSARPTQIASNIVQWSLLNMTIGTTNEIELKLRIIEDQDNFINRVQAMGGYNDRWVVAENYSSLQQDWLGCCPTQLTVAKEAFVDSRDRTLVHYRITLKNRENEAMVATITDELPAGMMFENSTLMPSDYSSRRISWNIIDLKPGKTKSIDYLARAMYGGTFVNQAHIEAQYLNGTSSAFADVSRSVYIAGEANSIDNSTWQPPACFGLNCTQQDLGKDWLSCPSCGIAEPQPISSPSSGDYGDDIP